MYTVKSLKEKKNYIVFSYNKNSKICFSMHFGFNNQELGQYFKNSKKSFFFF
jgi:hypothetical protein